MRRWLAALEALVRHKPHLRGGTRGAHTRLPHSRTGPGSQLVASGGPPPGSCVGIRKSGLFLQQSVGIFQSTELQGKAEKQLGAIPGKLNRLPAPRGPAAPKHRKARVLIGRWPRRTGKPAPASVPLRPRSQLQTPDFPRGRRTWRRRPPQRASSRPADSP